MFGPAEDTPPGTYLYGLRLIFRLFILLSPSISMKSKPFYSRKRLARQFLNIIFVRCGPADVALCFGFFPLAFSLSPVALLVWLIELESVSRCAPRCNCCFNGKQVYGTGRRCFGKRAIFLFKAIACTKNDNYCEHNFATRVQMVSKCLFSYSNCSSRISQV